ncbi:hypothetical protein SDRG_14453 [Saprolegnia diclina VS20]|uniref:Uncharacterized protein n=1 Tax=Saprolegnia diclina (strain VS20) TaxID=1156394 RepID=T0PQU3_SAPDV|nr:hypothetical protein SDRG_14453 [Saprolegnia diclina VS20]EQC27874.1 hypothetical protein SDRG_14453 [Saprolegnia diclina VS20]|eukprot:XP_008618804.1 hypothetical protein SDRG_14453 [Saprolegnia diclina VS20]
MAPLRWARYVGVSVALSVYCLYFFALYLRNDYFWVEFESSKIALQTIFNSALTLHGDTATTPFNLFTPQYAYDAQHTGYGRLLLHQDLTTLPAALAALRRLSVAREALGDGSVPTPVAYVHCFDAIIVSQLQTNVAFQALFEAIPRSSSWSATPLSWQGPNLYYGGSPLCGYSRLQSFAQDSFNHDDECNIPSPIRFTWTPLSGLFAVAFGNVSSASDVCSHADGNRDCLAYVKALLSAAALLPPMPDPPTTLAALDVRIMQTLAPSSNASNMRLETPLIISDEWAPYGLLSFYDWVHNARELARLPGPAPLQSTSLSVYYWYIAAASSVILSLLAVAVAVVWLLQPSNHEVPLLHLNRIVSFVYLNRGLLISRGLTACVCLGSSDVVSVASKKGLVQLTLRQKPLHTTWLLAGETLWLVYVGQELLHPLTHGSTYLSVTSCLSWVLVAALDILVPLTVEATLHRSCFAVDMTTNVQCESGHVRIGDAQRVLTIFAVHMAVILSSTVGRMVYRRWKSGRWLELENRSFVLPSSVLRHLPLSDGRTFLSPAKTAALCGVFCLPNNRVFDTKLWLTLSPDTYIRRATVHELPAVGRRTLPSLGASPVPTSWLQKKLRPVALLFGGLYLVATLSSNVAYLAIAQAYMANDFFWAEFYASGTYAFVANTFNRQLIHSSTEMLSLSATSLVDYSTLYNDSTTQIACPATTAQRVLHDPSVVTLHTAVSGLRSMEPCQLPWLFTQYCWLDLDQRWAMASTAARQARCASSMATNGAVYLEVPLRNINDWSRWEWCWGSSFAYAIRADLEASLRGRSFLSELQPASSSLSVAGEIVYWVAHGISRFDLQYQNYKTIGFREAFVIENALGLKHALPLSQVASHFHPAQQTSMRMYWSFASDLWAVSTNTTRIGGRSLLSSSANFAFTNVSSEQLLIDNGTLAASPTNELALLRSSLGPFNAVDMIFLLPPARAMRLYADFTTAIAALTTSNLSAQTAYLRLPITALATEASTHIPSISTSGDNNQWTQPFACFLLSSGLCRTDVVNCASDYATIAAFVATHNASLAPAMVSSASTADAMTALGVSVLQFAYVGVGRAPAMLQQPLFGSSDAAWTFYGWLLLCEWIDGRREVIRFDGDHGSLSVISHSVSAVLMTPDASHIPHTYSYNFLQALVYVSTVLVAIAAVVLVYALVARGRIDGRNLFEINRSVGIAWIGRSFLLVRSVTALCLLNTQTLLLARRGEGALLNAVSAPWYNQILAASEATWLVYVLNDAFSCITQQYTATYAPKSALLTWVCTVLHSVFSPLGEVASLSRQCALVDMDSGLECVSGRIPIGSFDRLQTSILIVLTCMALTFGYDRWTPAPALALPTLVLNSQSFYALFLDVSEGEYLIDCASAAMAGLLTLNYSGTWHILDVKAWRVVSIPAKSHGDDLEAKRYKYYVPLCQI